MTVGESSSSTPDATPSGNGNPTISMSSAMRSTQSSGVIHKTEQNATSHNIANNNSNSPIIKPTAESSTADDEDTVSPTVTSGSSGSSQLSDSITTKESSEDSNKRVPSYMRPTQASAIHKTEQSFAQKAEPAVSVAPSKVNKPSSSSSHAKKSTSGTSTPTTPNNSNKDSGRSLPSYMRPTRASVTHKIEQPVVVAPVSPIPPVKATKPVKKSTTTTSSSGNNNKKKSDSTSLPSYMRPTGASESHKTEPVVAPTSPTPPIKATKATKAHSRPSSSHAKKSTTTTSSSSKNSSRGLPSYMRPTGSSESQKITKPEPVVAAPTPPVKANKPVNRPVKKAATTKSPNNKNSSGSLPSYMRPTGSSESQKATKKAPQSPIKSPLKKPKKKKSIAEQLLAELLDGDSPPNSTHEGAHVAPTLTGNSIETVLTPTRGNMGQNAETPSQQAVTFSATPSPIKATPTADINHVSVDFTGNVKDDRPEYVKNSPPRRVSRKTPPPAPSPARGADDWLTGIRPNTNHRSKRKEVDTKSKGESTFTKNPETLASAMSAKTEFHDEIGLNTTMPETPTKSEDGRSSQDGLLLMKKKLWGDDSDRPNPLERMSNIHLSGLFACLVMVILGVIMFLVYVLTQPEILPPTLSPTLSIQPSDGPSASPTDWVPSASPSSRPSRETLSPSEAPSGRPSVSPSRTPSTVPTPLPSWQPSISPTERDRAEDLSRIIGTYSPTLKQRIQTDTGSKQRAAFDWLIKDPDFYSYDESKLLQRYVLALFSLEVRVPNPGNQRHLRGEDAAEQERRQLNWNAMETWRQYTDECTWFTSYYFDRVGCDRTGTWKRLVLYNIDLEGTIPSELALLSRMETVILSNHTLSGTIPRQLARLPLLKKLDLSGNRLRGMIPTQFGTLQRLEEVYLQRNQLGNIIPLEFQNLPSLQHLDLSENGLVGRIPTQLARVRTLISLRLEKNNIGNSIPPEFANLMQLTELDVSHNGIIGTLPTILGTMQAMKYLDLSHNAISGSLPTEIGGLRSLTHLGLGYNRLLGTVPLHLGLYNLQYIDLANNQFIGTLPGRLGNLRGLLYLDISGNPISGPFPNSVCNLVKPPVFNRETGLLESPSMFKANCAFVGCACCTDCA